MSNPEPILGEVPRTLRIAGAVIAAEGIAGLAVAVYLVIRALGGHHEAFISGYGTAVWFILIGGGVLAGGWAVYRGRRWGRAIGVITQILLIPVAWSLLTTATSRSTGRRCWPWSPWCWPCCSRRCLCNISPRTACLRTPEHFT